VCAGARRERSTASVPARSPSSRSLVSCTSLRVPGADSPPRSWDASAPRPARRCRS
jgi:hypothetical protein